MELIKELSFTIPGEVVPQGRPRATRQGGFVRMYQPATSTNFQNLVKMSAMSVMQDDMPFENPICLTVHFFLPIPKSTSKKKIAEMLKFELLPLKYPDLDNALKGIMDGMTGVTWKDDKQVYTCYMAKYYSERPRTEVTVGVMKI